MIALFISLLLWRPNRSRVEYFYKSDEEFQKEQIAKHHPELLYQLASKQYEQGLIDKDTRDKAIEVLIKDISI